jgi:hypothetical protein
VLGTTKFSRVERNKCSKEQEEGLTMSWASKKIHYSKQSHDVDSAVAEFDTLRARDFGTEVEGSIYKTNGPLGEGRVIYVGADSDLDLGAEWTVKDKRSA